MPSTDLFTHNSFFGAADVEEKKGNNCTVKKTDTHPKIMFYKS